MIKKLIFSFSLLISIASFAQEGTASPYSFYGIGDVRFKGAVDSRSMAGISVFPDSIHLNLQNPAQLASLKMMTFGVGGTYTQSTLKTTTQKSKTKRTTFDYLTVGLPLGKLGVSFGVAPYSSVGYKIQNVITGNNAQVSRYSGLGGVNRTFVGLGFYIAKNFSIGADLQYNFGKIETTSITYLEGIQNGSREINTSNVTGVTFNTGFAYQAKVAKKLFLFTSGTFSPKSNLNLSNTRIIDIVQLQADGSFSTVGDPYTANVVDATIVIPQKLSLSAGFGLPKKWSVASEITFQNTSEMSNRFNDITNAVYENSTRYAIGGYFIPKYNSFTSYWDKVTYRAGFRHENLGLVINNQSITDTAFTFGLGLPLGGTFSNVNLGFELGKKGTASYNLVQENYGSISIGLVFNDKWFIRRKIN
jgi:long-subunit fatty acid transport protein